MRELLKSPELRIVLVNALFQPLGAIALGLGIVVGLIWWSPFLIVGVAGYVLIVLSALRDEAENRRVVQTELHPPRRLNMALLAGQYRAALQQALDTQRQIDQAVMRAEPRLRDTLKRLTADVDDLIAAMYDIALKAQDVQVSLAAIDRTSLSADIARLQRQVPAADGYLRSQYEATLDNKQEQLANLNAADEALRRWEAQLAHAQASVAEILSQIIKIKSSAIMQATFSTDGLSDNLREQTTALRETAKAFDRLQSETI